MMKNVEILGKCGKDYEKCGKLYFDHAFPHFFPDFDLFDLRYLRLWVE